jgi:hypothetical protein
MAFVSVSRSALAALSLAVFTWSAGCSTLGPKAEVSLVDTEIAKTTTVDNIVVAKVTGIDSSGNTGKALLATALKTYGKRSRPLAAVEPVLSAAGLPEAAVTAIAAPYQVAFAKATEAFLKGGERPEGVTLPGGASEQMPKSLDEAKTLISKLSDEAKALGALAKALSGGTAKEMGAALDKSKSTASLLRKVDGALFGQLDVTYVLVTHVVGTEADWEGGKPCHMAIGLVNAKTGKLRYFGTTQATKGMVPVPYMAQLGMMSNSIFDAIEESAPLPVAKKAQASSAKPKKGKKS